jgi:hypothetical protein
MANEAPSTGGNYTLQLVLAWAVVAIPLLWGIQQTWVNVQKLFAAPTAASATAAAPATTSK